MVIHTLSSDVDLPPEQIAAEQIVEHQGGHPALVPGGIVLGPAGSELGSGPLGTPTAANGTFDVGEKQWCHAGDPARGH
ncbi:hypothetical protein SCWH03_30230 [Streptomyces pacificus]|uniref:Uncharacterized protein n=1 Tax=Streptomyces pacificus TaxID=2705029 RepID=A0A6A0AUZ9_9ACTN|nr:hypothetical protein SCWH03_30230 [Streptomyces pacificus]